MPTGSISTEIDIDAPPEAVWAVLADGPAYPAWNPFVKKLEGELNAGQRITVHIQPPGKSVATFKPVLLKGKVLPKGSMHGCGHAFMQPGHAFQLPASLRCTSRLALPAVEPGKELRWRGSLPIPGLFVGEHYFVITPVGDGKSHLTHGEHFHGLLVPLLGGMLKASEAGFKDMNSALKQRAEAAAAAGSN